MLGLFKRMLSKSEPVPQAPPAKLAPPARPLPVARAAVAAPIPQSAVQPLPVRPRVARPPATSTHVQVALTSIAASLPEALSHKVPSNPDQFIAIPVEKVLPQLGEGQVVITAAELRECSPEHFGALVGHDDLPVTLPLAEIVKQLSSTHFARRDQQCVDVPEEVASVFAPGSVSGPKAVTVKPASVHRPQPTVTATAAPATLPTSASASASAPAPETKIAMSAQALAALNGRSAPVVPTTTRAATVFAKPAAATTASRGTGAQKPVASPKKTKMTGELTVPLASVWDEWAAEVRAQLTEVDVTNSQILVPFEQLEPAMKAGKVVFSWQEVAAWMKPPLPIPPTAKVGEMAVELPLKAIAPLFMAHHRGSTQKRVAVDAAIPDLFDSVNEDGSAPAQVPQAPRVSAVPAATPEPAPAAPVAVAPARQPAPAPAPATPTIPASAPLQMPAAPSVSPEPKPVAAPQAPAHDSVSLEQIIGTAANRFSAKEIVTKAARLPGASGALLALSDGLLVTAQMPPEMKAETIAAFLPQMFGRMNQYTKELALGPLTYLALGVETGHWHVIKAPNIYFAVLGKRDETLPLNLLAQIAAELSSQSK